MPVFPFSFFARSDCRSQHRFLHRAGGLPGVLLHAPPHGEIFFSHTTVRNLLKHGEKFLHTGEKFLDTGERSAETRREKRRLTAEKKNGTW